MEFAQLLTDIETKTTEKQVIARQVAELPHIIPDLIARLSDKKAAVRFGCAKVLHLLAETHPSLLYPHFDTFAQLLESDSSIMQAEGAFILSHLARVDSSNRLDGVLDLYLAPIQGPSLTVAANAIQGAARIAEAKPRLADRLARALLDVPGATYKTEECVRVACGEAVEALDLFAHLVGDVRPIRKFIHTQAASPRKSTRAKAEKVLKRRGW